MSDLLRDILVIGCGSIGERHARSFLATGRARVTGCDNRAEVRRHMAATYGIDCAADWRELLAAKPFHTVVVATPAPLHLEAAHTALGRLCHVLVEKPLALALDGIDRLMTARDAAQRFVAVGYTLHSSPAFRAAREHIRSDRGGRLRHVAVSTGQYFPQFRPAYRDIYYRDHAQGGGAIQDALTHMANAVEWIAGPATRVTCDAAHQVLEGVTVEDTVNVVARHGDVLASYSLNQFQAPNETRLDFHSETESVRVESHAQRWGVQARGAGDWTWRAAPVASRDALYVAQASEFLDACEGSRHVLCTLEEGRQTLRFNLAALQSWRENRTVEL